MRDNYIPIHAMVFARSLVEKGCRFDEAFNIYEDWDFWLQMSRETIFHHIDKISAYYRQGGDSDTEPGDHSHRYSANNKLGKARAAIFEKWKPLWTGEDINQLIGELDQSYLNYVIVARDDGSCDDSLKILDEYSKKFTNKFHLLDQDNLNRGASGSFSYLIEYVLENQELLGLASAYMMFCDQDDIWCADKIVTQVAAMLEAEEGQTRKEPLPLLIRQ
jgi:hypothetical protein